MAARKQAAKTKPEHYCRDCANAYDFHEKNVKGVFFMCKCPYYKYSRFLNHDSCTEHYKPRH